MIKKILLGVLGALMLLVAVLVIRTLNYGNAQAYEAMTLPDVPAYDSDLAARRVGEAIQFPTITVASGDPRPGAEGPWLDFQAWMEASYPAFHAAAVKEIVPGGYTVLYTWSGSDARLAPIMLMAHQDVVPVNIGTEGDWDARPFSGEIVDGYIYGRGAIDNKGALVAQLEALDALARSGFAPKRTIILMLGHDEEVSGSGAEAGVALLKSRGISPIMALDEGLLAIDQNPLTGGPLALIGVAEKGYITLRLTVTAQGGHSSTPPQNSATVRLARALVALDENQMPADLSKEPVSTLFVALGEEMPFVLRMAFANQWLFGGLIDAQMSQDPSTNAMIRTTTAPTMLVGSAKENVLAQRASAIVNFRIHPNDSESDVLAHIQRLTGDIEGLTVTTTQEGIRGTGASPVSPLDGKPYAVLASVARDMTNGAPVAPGLVVGATDARYATAITQSVYRFMPALLAPADLAGFHGTNERITVESVDMMVRGYAQIILAMDRGDEIQTAP